MGGLGGAGIPGKKSAVLGPLRGRVESWRAGGERGGEEGPWRRGRWVESFCSGRDRAVSRLAGRIGGECGGELAWEAIVEFASRLMLLLCHSGASHAGLINWVVVAVMDHGGRACDCLAAE